MLRLIPQIARSGDSTEMRGLWVVRDSLVSPQSIHQVVETAAKYHLNALFVQVRGRGDAWYRSDLEPRAQQLNDQPANFDPLRTILDEAHARGLQVHAWVNVYLSWSGRRAPTSPLHVWNAHRDWFARTRAGACTPAPGPRCEGAYLQPSNPAVQDHLYQVLTDLATRYDVDGIHLDYCRYPGPAYDFSQDALDRFRADVRPDVAPRTAATVDSRLGHDRLAYVHAFPQEWLRWRAQQITGLVARVSDAVRRLRPGIQVSAAVSPDADAAYRDRGQDWRGWLKAGYLDAVAIMAYDRDPRRVLAETRRAIAEVGADRVYTGIGAWRLQAHTVAREITAIRRIGAAGVDLFSYDRVHLRPGYLDTLARGVFASRAVPPGFRRLPSAAETPAGAARSAASQGAAAPATGSQR